MNTPTPQPATVAEYESERAIRDMRPIYRRVCPGCAGTGIAGCDVDGIWRGGGCCGRCGGLSYIEFTVVQSLKVTGAS